MKRKLLIFALSILLLLSLLFGCALGYTYFSKQHLYPNGLSDLFVDLKTLTNTVVNVHSKSGAIPFRFTEKLYLYGATPFLDPVFLEIRKLPLEQIDNSGVRIAGMGFPLSETQNLQQVKSEILNGTYKTIAQPLFHNISVLNVHAQLEISYLLTGNDLTDLKPYNSQLKDQSIPWMWGRQDIELNTKAFYNTLENAILGFATQVQKTPSFGQVNYTLADGSSGYKTAPQFEAANKQPTTLTPPLFSAPTEHEILSLYQYNNSKAFFQSPYVFAIP